MWQVIRAFSYRGTRYQPGDVAPAEDWPNRKAFVALRRIKFVQEYTPEQETFPAPPSTGPVDSASSNLPGMKRAELDDYATKLGLDPSFYTRKEALIEAIEESLEELKKNDLPESDTDESTAPSDDESNHSENDTADDTEAEEMV